jgi:hypothetical protein
VSIPGVGAATAFALLVEMPELGALEHKCAASLAGLAPGPRGSGWLAPSKKDSPSPDEPCPWVTSGSILFARPPSQPRDALVSSSPFSFKYLVSAHGVSKRAFAPLTALPLPVQEALRLPP